MSGASVFRREEFLTASLNLGTTSIDLKDYATTGIRAVVVGPSGIGKCHIGTDTVLVADGRLVPFAEMSCGEIASLDDVSLQNTVAVGRCVESHGRQRCFTVRTATGYRITVNGHHPLLRVDGWAATKELQVGDHIATLRRCVVEGWQPLEDGLATFAGLMVGDGGCSQTNSSPRFSGRDADIRGWLTAFTASRGWRLEPLGEDLIIYGRRISDPPNASGPHAVLRTLGLLGQGSHTKRVPPQILTAPNDQVAQFLGAYFACDGSVSRAQPMIEFYSVNDTLLREVKHLLLRFGIVSTLAPKAGRYKGQPHRSWRLRATGEFARRFAQVIDRKSVV